MNIEECKKDLDQLIRQADLLWCAAMKEYNPDQYASLSFKEDMGPLPNFFIEYQSWYTQAMHIVKLLLNDRLDDFISYYKTSQPRENISHMNCGVEDLLVSVDTKGRSRDMEHWTSIAIFKFAQQREILRSVSQRFDSSLFNLRQLVQADIFDSDLDSARALLENGHLRAAGAVAGVVLEKYLEGIVAREKVNIKKPNPMIGDLIIALGSGGILQTHELGGMKSLNNIRILCVHNKNKEPTKEEVSYLINGITNLIE